MRILILGRTEILYKTVLKLEENNEICGIITATAAREYKKDEADFKKLANQIGCPYRKTQKLDEKIIEFIKSVKGDIVVSMNWVSIIEKEIIDLFKYGILNAHFADLPRYKGNAVVNWAILNGEKTIPLTIHYMNPDELDSGDILAQKDFELLENTSIKDVYDFALFNIPRMFYDLIEKIKLNKVKIISQKKRKNEAFRCYPRIPQDSKIDWNFNAEYIHKLVKASTHPYSGAYSYIKCDGVLKKIFIWKSRIVNYDTNDIASPGHIISNDKETGETWVMTGKGIIALEIVQYDNEEEFKPGKVWKSIRRSFGVDLEEEIINILNKLKNC